ncbi:MAG: DUF4190 domain-containing protein [Phycisphaerales bacterium]|nr:DUF4190 domain-containing protein [Phycisphaerales bacterium]
MTPPPPRPDNILDYARPPVRVSRLAIVSLIVSIFAALSFFFIIPPILAFILALVADHRIVRRPHKLAGIGYTTTAIHISVYAGILALFVFVWLVPQLIANRGCSGRSSCAANLRGIGNSIVIYAAANSEHFPVVTYAPYSPALNNPTAAATYTNPTDTINAYFRPPYPQAGSVTANLWLLVLEGLSPKLFICKNYDGVIDRYVTGPPELQDRRKNYYDNFQNDQQLSYSFAYPWKAGGTVGNWWRNSSDASMPIGSDMAPEYGTGTPRRVLTNNSAGTAGWSSANHNSDGQNVAFGDVHVDYTKVPTVGTSNDNIWTTSANPSTGPSDTGIPADKSPPNLTADEPPYDTIMYPIRNLDTGRF